MKRTLSSIRQYCQVSHRILVLSQGQPDEELIRFLAGTGKDVVELITSPVNLGCGGGRHLLADRVETPFTMMLDDDMYLTDGVVPLALAVLEKHPEIGAIGMPQYDVRGRMISAGGRKLFLRGGTIYRKEPTLKFDADLIEVDDLNGGAMLYRTDMRGSFAWDGRFYGALDDLDKSVQILRTGKWRQAIIPKAVLIHDRDWLDGNEEYARMRFDGLAQRRSYKLFRSKWGLRFDPVTHFLFETVYPVLSMTSCYSAIMLLRKFVERKNAIETPFSPSAITYSRILHEMR